MTVLSDEEIRQINSAFEETAFEMSLPRRDVISRTQDIGRQFCYHLLKCALYPNSEDLNHWLNEMYGWFSHVCDLRTKPKDKRLSNKNFIENFIVSWIEYANNVTSFAKKIQAENGKAVFDEQTLFSKIKELHSDLIKMYNDNVEKEVFIATMQQWLKGVWC